jgi:hypothetical protein
LSKRDLSAVGDVADEVRAMLGSDDLSKATWRQVHRAIHEYLLLSDKTFLEGMAAARSLVKRGRKPASAPILGQRVRSGGISRRLPDRRR